MKKITVKANPGRSVPLSATCHRVDNGPRVVTADHGDVVLELRDLVAVQYIRRSIKRGDLAEVTSPVAFATASRPARPGDEQLAGAVVDGPLPPATLAPVTKRKD